MSPQSHGIEPEILDRDMNRADLIFVLENLVFGRSAHATLRLDRQVRDYLLDALRRHGHASTDR